MEYKEFEGLVNKMRKEDNVYEYSKAELDKAKTKLAALISDAQGKKLTDKRVMALKCIAADIEYFSSQVAIHDAERMAMWERIKRG